MSLVVVGGDNLGLISDKLKDHGFEVVKHISGRKIRDVILPEKADAILLLTDYVNHSLATALKYEAKKKGMKAIFAKRSWSHIYSELTCS